MEHVDCPECRTTAKRMPVLSFITGTDDYYLCDGCRQVWHRPHGATVPPAPIRLGAFVAAASHTPRTANA